MNKLPNSLAKIKMLKYIFLSTGICIMITIFILLYVQSTDLENISSNDEEQNTPKLSAEYALSINNPVFEGVSSDLLPYKISAENVVKNIANKYILSHVTGKYKLMSGDMLLKAKTGILNEDTKFVILDKNVQIECDGITLNSDQVKVNLNTKDAESDNPVDINFNESNIKADSFKTKDSGNEIIFQGNVKSDFKLQTFE